MDIIVGARATGHAVPGCNVYTLDQAAGVLAAAEAARSPLILQVHPGGVGAALWPLIAGLRVLADAASVPVALHLDHCADIVTLRRAIASGVDGVMVDGSTLDTGANARLVALVATDAHAAGVAVEAELGRLSGSEDGWTVAAREAQLTQPGEVAEFLSASGADMLAVSIGNVHGATPVPPRLDLSRLASIGRLTDVPLVLHGGSGLDDAQLDAAIARGICKVNVNTELRAAYSAGLAGHDAAPELVDVLSRARSAVGSATSQVIERFGSAGLADPGGPSREMADAR